MILASSPARQVRLPAAIFGRRARVHRLSGIAALREAGFVIEPVVTADDGVMVSADRATALLPEVEAEIGELSSGRREHARRTIASLRAARLDDGGQARDLMERVYAAHDRGAPAPAIGDIFLDTLETWLMPSGIAKVDLVFDHLDLDRVPGSIGVLLLASTRLTRAAFARRDAFVDRFARWLLGRDGRTSEDVEAMLRGLRE